MAAPVPNTILPRYALRGREVPQEHSHEQFITTVRASLNLNNPDKIVDPIFGLLGNAAAAAGQVGTLEELKEKIMSKSNREKLPTQTAYTKPRPIKHSQMPKLLTMLRE